MAEPTLIQIDTLARWLARKEVKIRLRAVGKRPWDYDTITLNKAAVLHVAENRARLTEEARATFIAIRGPMLRRSNRRT
jgi:hypothetical protein